MNILYVDYSPPDPAEQLGLDEALLNLREHETGDGFLRFWEPERVCVVLGHTNSAGREVRLDRCRARHIPVFRRPSGGGTVVQGPGCLNFSLILEIAGDSHLATAGGTNDYIMHRHAEILSALTHEQVDVSGFSDLTIGSRKFSGNAQRRRLHSLLFHGCLLLDFDLSLIEELLPMPSREPHYRESRPHTEFLRNLGLPARTVRTTLREAWGARHGANLLPLEEARRLARERYENPSWTFK